MPMLISPRPTPAVLRTPLSRCVRAIAFGLAVAALALIAAPNPASAQGRLEAQYEATLAGIPVGKGAWTVDIGDDQFSAAANGGTSGLLKAFAGGSGTGAAQGRVVNGALVSTNYSASTTTSKKTESIHMALANGTVKEYGIEPDPPVDPDRIPVTDAQRRGVYDPMSGAMIHVPGTADPLSPEACHTGAPIFDGRMRYDLSLDFKRMETVRARRAIRARWWCARCIFPRSPATSPIAP